MVTQLGPIGAAVCRVPAWAHGLLALQEHERDPEDAQMGGRPWLRRPQQVGPGIPHCSLMPGFCEAMCAWHCGLGTFA